ncbi:hypothetical protein GCM10023163_14290 [Aestuariibaculum suncheonense]
MILFISIGIYRVQAQTPQIWKRYTGEITDPNIPVLPNYSYAGYMRGEMAIPETFTYPIFDVTDPAYGAVPDDANSDQAAIQAAIDAAEANGSGIVFFPPGEYLVNTDPNNTSPITINSSNIILKGSGSTPGGTIINMKNYMRLPSGVSAWDNKPMFVFTPVNSPSINTANVTQNASRGDNFIYVDNPQLFQNEKYCKLVMDANTAANNDYLDGKTPRSIWTSIINNGVALSETHEIESVDLANNRVYLKDPIIDDVNASYNWRLETITLLENCGFEDIHFKANFTDSFVHHQDYIHDYGWKAIRLNKAAHSWVRRSRFSDLSNSVKFTGSSYASSILNILVDGNSGHSLSIVDGSSSRILQGLIWDNTSSGQFHGSDMSGKACGSVVWRIDAQKGRGMDLHASMPRTNLVDLYTMVLESGAGGSYVNLPHHLTGLTMWNIKRTGTSSLTLDLWNDCGGNYCGLTVVNPIIVGYHGNSSTTFVQSNVKYEESNGTKVSIESLYEAQLEFRLGIKPAWVDAAISEWDTLRTEWYATVPPPPTPTESTLEPINDAHVRSGSFGNTNYGSLTSMEVKNASGKQARKIFLSFDVSALTNISSAKLRLTPDSPGATDYDLKYVSDDNWNETSITWNNMPTASNSLGIQPGGSGPLEWDIISQVQSEINGDGILSLELTGVSSNVYGSFFSKEHQDTNVRPVLVIGGTSSTSSIELLAEEDAYARSGSYTNTTFNDTDLIAKNDGAEYTREAYLKFNLSSISDQIVSAKLQLVPKTGVDPATNVIHDLKFVSDDSWSETTINWSNKPLSSTLLDSQIVSQTGTTMLWDVTAQAENERTGDGYLSIQLSTASNAWVVYNSSESGSGVPKLILELSEGNSSKQSSTKISAELEMSIADLKSDIPSDYFGYFPNPTKDYLNLKWGETIRSYTITDLGGRVIKTMKSINQKEISIDVQNIKTGIYFLELLNYSATNRKVVRFVKK